MSDFLALPMNGGQRYVRVGETVLDRPDEKGQWRPELVTDVTEEGGLRTIELRERLGASLCLLVRAGIGKTGPELIGHQIEEDAVLIVEGTSRVQADDESDRWRVCARG